jgi:hypothetical protein
MSDNYCKCYTSISLTCGKCLKPFKIPRNKDEQILDIKKRINDLILEKATLRLELKDLENDSDCSDSDNTIKL